MIKIPYDDLVQKIVENSSISKEEIETKIKKKMDQLSGLISKEGAAHIIANELNIKLNAQFSGRIQIKNVLQGLRDVEVLGKVLRKYDLKEFQVGERKGKVANLLIGDETGTIRLVMWGHVAEKVNEIKENDIVKVKSAYSRENNGNMEIHMNERSELEINPKGETVEVSNQPIKTEFKRKNIADLKENETNIELLGTLVDMFDPKFFSVCSQCNKSVKENACQAHPNADIKFSYVLNAFLDDGTDNLRAVFFRDQALALTSMKDEDMLKIRDEPESFADVKKNMLGSLVKVTGRVVKNQMFERLEFMASGVNINPDPKEELAKLKNDV